MHRGCTTGSKRGRWESTSKPLERARRHLYRHCADLVDRVELISTDGSLDELGEQRFDLLISKESFEYYDDPEAFLPMIQRFVAPGGMLTIGFGTVCEGPTGGHIDFMTKLLWAHVLFPETTIMQERRRFRPAEDARRFADVRGGLNKMTLARFEAIMRQSRLRSRYYATNVSVNPVVKAMDLVSRVPPLREYFTANVYSLWEKALA